MANQQSASARIRSRLKSEGVRFWANDNIADYLTDRDKEELIKELTSKFEDVLDSGQTPEVTSMPIPLLEGRRYGFSFVVKQGYGGNWGQVAIRKEGDPTPAILLEPIRGTVLTGFLPSAVASVRIDAHPRSLSVLPGRVS